MSYDLRLIKAGDKMKSAIESYMRPGEGDKDVQLIEVGKAIVGWDESISGSGEMNADLIEKMNDVFDNATRKASLDWPNGTADDLQIFGIAEVIRAVLEWEDNLLLELSIKDTEAHGDTSILSAADFVAALKREAGL